MGGDMKHEMKHGTQSVPGEGAPVCVCRCCGKRPVAIEAWCAWCALIGPTPPDEIDGIRNGDGERR